MELPVRRGRRWVVPALTGVIGLLVGVGVGVGASAGVAAVHESDEAAAVATASAAAEEGKSRELLLAVNSCGANRSYAVVGDEGQSLTIESRGQDDSAGVDIDQLFCIMDALDAPSAVTSHMEQTTSMDGRQTEEWDDYEISFSYHPDRGMDSVITLND
ncbi:hypothetical protein [Herbiconiux sp. VKM Ac-2851]|uniref:hypothetical protein n=1 Tax=Herbiconiux sp. VKM Ac-2851 TaxID=2739025 RepID=UPI001564A7B8|nr:hypothetical protein [Herbiconiux sp. VKM Ac-2851]NQX36237.1 hypothetical protein [Herbiconiux sp. VKM Ac-2851]